MRNGKLLLIPITLLVIVYSVSAMSVNKVDDKLTIQWEPHIIVKSNGDEYFRDGFSEELINETIIGDNDVNYPYKSKKKPHSFQFKNISNSSALVRLEKGNKNISFEINRLQYYNGSTYQIIDSPLSTNANVNNRKAKFQNAFTNVDMIYESEARRVKELFNVTTQINSSSINNPVFEIYGGIDLSNLEVFVNGVNKTGQNFTTNSTVSFVNGGDTVFKMPRPNATDSAGNFTQGSLRFESSSGEIYFSAQIPYSWIQGATYPILIDPTIEEDILQLSEEWDINPISSFYDNKLEGLARIMQSLDPKSVLRRGYAIVRNQGRVVRSGNDVKVGDKLMLQLLEDQLTTEVKDVRRQAS